MNCDSIVAYFEEDAQTLIDNEAFVFLYGDSKQANYSYNKLGQYKNLADDFTQIGLIGSRAGIVILDFDGEKGKKLYEEKFSDYPVNVITPHGYHLYVQADGSFPRNVMRSKEYGFDLIVNSYAIFSGADRQFMHRDIAPAEVLDRLPKKATAVKSIPTRTIKKNNKRAWFFKGKTMKSGKNSIVLPDVRVSKELVVRDFTQLLRETDEGRRKNTLYYVAGVLSDVANAPDDDPIWNKIEDAAMESGLNSEDIYRTILSAQSNFVAADHLQIQDRVLAFIKKALPLCRGKNQIGTLQHIYVEALRTLTTQPRLNKKIVAESLDVDRCSIRNFTKKLSMAGLVIESPEVMYENKAVNGRFMSDVRMLNLLTGDSFAPNRWENWKEYIDRKPVFRTRAERAARDLFSKSATALRQLVGVALNTPEQINYFLNKRFKSLKGIKRGNNSYAVPSEKEMAKMSREEYKDAHVKHMMITGRSMGVLYNKGFAGLKNMHFNFSMSFDEEDALDLVLAG